MSLFELFITAVALSMDAFAVAICKGLSVQKVRIKHVGIVGLYFGGFQALMPLLGSAAVKWLSSAASFIPLWRLQAFGASLCCFVLRKKR